MVLALQLRLLKRCLFQCGTQESTEKNRLARKGARNRIGALGNLARRCELGMTLRPEAVHVKSWVQLKPPKLPIRFQTTFPSTHSLQNAIVSSFAEYAHGQACVNGLLAIFYDPNQNIFRSENSLPTTGAVFNLKVNCRNTREFYDYSVKHCKFGRTSSVAPGRCHSIYHIAAELDRL